MADAPRPRGRLRPAELAEAAVLGDVALILSLAGWWLPFGYVLSYTSFAYSQLQGVPETTGGTGAIQVSFKLTNSGTRAGAEVTQVYLGLPANTGEPPKRLVGWAKIEHTFGCSLHDHTVHQPPKLRVVAG